jgi:hypothetical protein
MPIDIGTWAKYLKILLIRPLRVPKLMGCVEMFFSANVDHLPFKLAAKLGKKYTDRNSENPSKK